MKRATFQIEVEVHDQDEDLLVDGTVAEMIHQRFNLTRVRVDTVKRALPNSHCAQEVTRNDPEYYAVPTVFDQR